MAQLVVTRPALEPAPFVIVAEGELEPVKQVKKPESVLQVSYAATKRAVEVGP